MTDASSYQKIEKLNNDNWLPWKESIILVLEMRELWDYVNPEGGATGNAKQNMAALAQIRLSMEMDQMTFLGSSRNPRLAWKSLLAAKESNTAMSQVTRRIKLSNMKMGDNDSAVRFTAQMDELIQQIAKDSDTATAMDMVNAVYLLNALPARYEMFKTSVLQLDKDQFNFNEIRQRVIAEEERQQLLLTTTTNEISAAANYAGSTKQKRNNYSSSGNNNNKTSNSPSDECDHSYHPGGEAECWKLHPELKPAHLRNKNRRNQSASTAMALHYATMATAMGSSMPANQWLIDSGATTHMCYDRSKFSKIYSIPTTSIVLGEGNMIQANEAGDIHAKVTLEGKEIDLVLERVLYAPHMKRNLISMMGWNKQGIDFVIKNGICQLKKGDKIIGCTKAKNNLLSITITPLSQSEIHSANISVTHTMNQAKLWHSRLGHVNVADMKRLTSMVEGVDYNDNNNKNTNEISTISKCDTCMKCKSHQLAYPQEAQNRAKMPLELIHTDVCGPMTRTSREGYKYFISFIDDCTRFSTVYLLKKKSHAMQAFMVYKLWIEKTIERDIKSLRSDGGGEFMSNEFSQWLTAEGITRQISAPRSQQQNGVSERYNRTVVECARTMLEAAKLDGSYWGDAIVAANYIRNRLPTRALTNKTPYEAFYNRKPSLTHLRVFGCKAYALIDDSKRGKFDAKSELCMMIGYAHQYKAYRLYNTVTKKVINSRNVQFNENEFMNDNVAYGGDTNTIHTSKSKSKFFDVPIPLLSNESFNENENKSEFEEEVDFPIIDNNNNSERDESGSEDDQKEIINNILSNNNENIANESLHSNNENEIEGDDEISNNDTSSNHQHRQKSGTGLWKPGQYDIIENSDEIFDEFVNNLINKHSAVINSKTQIARMKLEQMVNDRHYNIKDVRNRIKTMKKERQNEASVAMAFHSAYAAEAIQLNIADPVTHSEAMKRADSEKWKEAEQEEINSVKKARTWKLVKLPPNRQPIGCKWVYKTKYNENGTLDKYKARLVAKGFAQKHGIDYTETFAPVVRFSSIRALLAIGAYYDLEIHQMDVKTAFLNGDLDHDIYMKQPEGYEVKGYEHLVCKLNKSLYGLKQAGRQWYEKIDSELRRMRFDRLATDNCIYIKQTNEYTIIIALYVDDLLILSNSMKELRIIKQQLAGSFEMKDLGEARFILGIKIDRNREKKTLSITQTEYVKNVIKNYGMEDSRRTTVTPMNPGMKFIKSGIVGDTNSEVVNIKQYQAAVGAIMYAMLGTRPDIAYSISKLAQYSNEPREQHWKAVKQLLRYLATTSNYCLTYSGNHNNNDEPKLLGYCDSDWANDYEDRRSTTGYVFMTAGGAISWKSKRQPTVALSSTEAEYMAASEATREAINWRMLLNELGFDITKPTIILSDNQGSIALTKNPEHHARSKHIDIRHHYVREQVALGSVEMNYINTDDMTADVLTKPLARDRHAKLINKMGMVIKPTESMRRLSGSVGIATSHRVRHDE
jgi:transposase InsO family protein